MEGGVEAEPVAARRPAEKVDPFGARSLADAIDDSFDVTDDLGRADLRFA
jgi:hypothetical protein